MARKYIAEAMGVRVSAILNNPKMFTRFSFNEPNNKGNVMLFHIHVFLIDVFMDVLGFARVRLGFRVVIPKDTPA